MRPLCTALLLTLSLAASYALWSALGPAGARIEGQRYLQQGLYHLAAEKARDTLNTAFLAGFTRALLFAAAASFVVLGGARLLPPRWPPRRLRRVALLAVLLPGLASGGLLAAVNLDVALRAGGRRHADSVLLVVIDTLRKDRLGCYGSGRGISPHIDLLAERSVRFHRAYSTSSWTRPAIASLVTSRAPTEHRIYAEGRRVTLPDRFLTLQEFFRDRNYETGSIVTNAHYKFGIDDEFDHQVRLENSAPHSSAEVVDAAQEFLDRVGERSFFLLLHMVDPHDPYGYREGFSTTREDSALRKLDTLHPGHNTNRLKVDAPENLEVVRRTTRILGAEELAEMEANYDGEVGYLDHHLGRLWQFLEERGLWGRVVVAFTADHGEEFLDHGSYWHGFTLYNELVQVPLLIHAPGREPADRHDNVSILDIFPTVVGLVGERLPARFTPSGIDLFAGAAAEERAILCATEFRSRLKFSLVQGRYKLIRYAEGDLIGLFDLEQDPGEQRDLSAERPDLVAALGALLTERIGPNPRRRGRGEAIELDAETLRSLQALGYDVEAEEGTTGDEEDGDVGEGTGTEGEERP